MKIINILVLLVLTTSFSFSAEEINDPTSVPLCIQNMDPKTLDIPDQKVWDRKPKHFFLDIETENRTTFSRDYFGSISMNIKPREGDVIEIGGKLFRSPKNIKGLSIDIGTFHIDHDQSDEEFLKTIHATNPIVYKTFG